MAECKTRRSGYKVYPVLFLRAPPAEVPAYQHKGRCGTQVHVARALAMPDSFKIVGLQRTLVIPIEIV